MRSPALRRHAPPLLPHAAVAAALTLATSCVPGPRARPAAVAAAHPPAKPETDGRRLLRDLALNVPAGVPDTALAPAAAAPTTGAWAAPAPAFTVAGQSPDDQLRATDCLTAAIYYEARSEPLDGQRAVAQVVLNRVRDRAFPSSVCGVVFQGSERRTGCQFSFTCDGSMLRPRNWLAWARSREVAERALAGDVYAPVGSATHYHADYVNPWWAPSLLRVAQVGTHIFYRWGGALERALAFRQSYAGAEPDVTAPQVAAAGDAGVQVFRGGSTGTVAGVLIHRGEDAGLVDAADVEDAVPAAPRERYAAGVRVHVGAGEAAERAGEADPT